MLFDEDYIFRKLKQKIKRLRKKFDFKDSVKYSTQKIDLNEFFYIKKVLQQEKSFSSKN